MSGHGKFAVEYKGVTIYCQSPEDAARVAQELGQRMDTPQFQRWQVHEFVEFISRIQVWQRRLLAFLLEAGRDSATDTDIRTRLNFQNNRVLAGVLSGLSKVAMALDIDPRRVYWMQPKYESGKITRTYSLTRAFREAARENAWPETKDLEIPEEEGEE
jgi:hypothetical protein